MIQLGLLRIMAWQERADEAGVQKLLAALRQQPLVRGMRSIRELRSQVLGTGTAYYCAAHLT